MKNPDFTRKLISHLEKTPTRLTLNKKDDSTRATSQLAPSLFKSVQTLAK